MSILNRVFARPRTPDIVTPSGTKVTFDETTGAESLTLSTAAGQVVRLGGSPPQVTVEDGSGNTIELTPAGITIQAAGAVDVQASTLRLTAGQMQLVAGMITTPAVLQCQTLIAQNVVASTYTPGQGNIW